MKAALSLVLCVILLTAGERAHGQAPAQMFDQYARDGTTAGASFYDTAEFLKTLSSSGPAWINAAPAGERARRRHVVALFALETAQGAPSTNNGLQILEWACELLRRQPKTEFERGWMVASASLFLRADFEQRFDVYAHSPPVIRPPSAMGHLDHALDRYPQEPRLRLMKLLQRPEIYALSSQPGANPDELVLVRSIGGQRFGPDGEGRIADSTRRLSELAESGDPGAEARVHVGWLNFHLNQLDASIEAFRAAAVATQDPFVRNLALVGAGLALGAQNKPRDAITVLRGATDAMPEARASAILLATHLFLAGQQREAAQIAGRAFGPAALDLEPWRHVIAPDRHVRDDVARLRAQLSLPPPPAVTAPVVQSLDITEPTPASASTPTQSSGVEVAPQKSPQFRSTANAVTLDVLVESRGVPVAGLTAGDFEVLDNGTRQSAEVVQVEAIPIDISLVIDFKNEVELAKFSVERVFPDSRLSPTRSYDWQRSPRLFERTREDMIAVAKLLRTSDQLRLLQVDEHVGRELWSMQRPPFPLDRLPSLPDRQGMDRSRWRATYGRMQGLYDVVAAALLRDTPVDRRHLVVVFTDGIDGASTLPPDLFLALAREATSVMYLARRDTQDEIAIQMAFKGSKPYASLLWPPDHHVIERATESTGGAVYYHPTGTLLPDFREIFDRFRKSYVIRYQTTAATPGWHNVTVRVLKSGKYDVKVRRGYTIPK